MEETKVALTPEQLNDIFEYLQENFYAEWCGKYGEPGYNDPEKGVVFANWNDVPKAIQEALEEAGYELEWSDEWTIDYNNDKAYRTSPSSYHWEPQWVMGDGEYIFPDDGADAFIEECSMTDQGQPQRCLPSSITPQDLKEEGYALFKADLENGWHPGQTDDPQELAKQAFDQGAERVVFRKTENSQFYIRFEAWVLWPEQA
jgi:hypothetical protein